MEKNDPRYTNYLAILRKELVPAMGCTEPIAIAYNAAYARKLLGKLPEEILVEASGNIIKNVKSVIVPNTGGHKGMEAAAAAGILYGDSTAGLEVIAKASHEDILKLDEYMKTAHIQTKPLDSTDVLDIRITVKENNHWAVVRTAREHTNIIYAEKDGDILTRKEKAEQEETPAEGEPDYLSMNVRDILDFASSCDLSDVMEILDPQIRLNSAIAAVGIARNYGANIGKVLLKEDGDSLKNMAKAYAAAGSDARMSGCDMPVVINSGSGNQGITCSVPVILYSEKMGMSREKMYRALLVSNLVTLHEKNGIGRLSAYCGAVSAGAGAGAGIAWLCSGGDEKSVTHTIVNALAITSGIVCDGAKPSCAAKIATAVDAGILGWQMYKNGQQFIGGDGLVTKGVENTIDKSSRLGKIGMKETDKEIIHLMTEC